MLFRSGKYDEVQHLTQCVSDYLRYVFKARDCDVALREEIAHIERYLEIQKIRYREGFEATIEIEEEVLTARIPQLIIHTFIENALKYTLNWDEEISIFLGGRRILQEEKPYLEIVIEDSGEGFPEDVLARLQSGESIAEGERRIGIMNEIGRAHV